MDNYNMEQVLGNIIAMNPTGTLTFDGTFGMNGNNDIVRSSEGASYENLKKTQSNEIICGYTENFENQDIENQVSENNFNYYYNYYFNNNPKNIISILIFIFFIILFIKIFI